MSNEHEHGQVFTCQCGDTFTSKEDLNDHFKTQKEIKTREKVMDWVQWYLGEESPLYKKIETWHNGHGDILEGVRHKDHIDIKPDNALKIAQHLVMDAIYTMDDHCNARPEHYRQDHEPPEPWDPESFHYSTRG